MYTKFLIFTKTNMKSYNEFVLDSVVFYISAMLFSMNLFWTRLFFKFLHCYFLVWATLAFWVYWYFGCNFFGWYCTCFRSIRILMFDCMLIMRRWCAEVLNVQTHFYIDDAQMMHGCVRFWFSTTSGVGSILILLLLLVNNDNLNLYRDYGYYYD